MMLDSMFHIVSFYIKIMLKFLLDLSFLSFFLPNYAMM